MPVEPRMRLHDQLAAMVALEHSIEVRCGHLVQDVAAPAVRELLERLGAASHDRRLALAARLQAVAPGTPVPDRVTGASMLEVLTGSRRYPASGALVAAHTLLGQAVLGYAVLLELAFRAADSVEHLGPGNTGDLAWEHLRACSSSVPEIARMLPYAVVDELEDEGEDCRCRCWTCGLGICGCPLAFRRRLDMAATEAGPTEAWPGITMVRPRPGTAAAEAGLARWDVVVAVGGRPIESLPTFRDAIEAHAPGEPIQLEVRKADGRTESVALPRP